MTRSVTVLINPAAGGGRAIQVGRRAVGRLREQGVDVTTIEGRTPGDALALLNKAVASGTDAVVAVGGDGLVNLVIQVLAGTDIPMGLIPAGTGNDLARVLQLPLGDADGAADVIARNATRTIDLGRVGGRWFATVLCSGFDSMVTERAGRLQWFSGPLRYNAAVVLQLAKLKKISYVIELDDVELRVDATLVSIGNGNSYGGGMAICPAARVDDGVLDVTVVRSVSRTRLLAMSPTLHRGTLTDLPEVDTYTAQRVTLRGNGIVAYADGERVGELPVIAQSVPRALRVFVDRDFCT